MNIKEIAPPRIAPCIKPRAIQSNRSLELRFSIAARTRLAYQRRKLGWSRLDRCAVGAEYKYVANAGFLLSGKRDMVGVAGADWRCRAIRRDAAQDPICLRPLCGLLSATRAGPVRPGR